MSQRINSLYAVGTPVGLLKGFSPAFNQLEVEVVVPYSEGPMPGVGEMLLVELGSDDALVGRVAKFSVAGHLTTHQGDAYLADLARTDDTPPPTVMRQMLRYTMKMNLLGHLRLVQQGTQSVFKFLVGERSFGRLGCAVRRPTEAALVYLCNIGLENDPSSAVLGHLAYGQQVLDNVPVRFSVDRLKSRRSFVFARAGYGKSNLMKYLIGQLYSAPPDVGLLIFDPEGEYALPDAEGRPGLINVPQLKDRISYYTNRDVPRRFSHVKKGDAYVDFGDFPPQDIVAGFVAREKREMVFANQLRSLSFESWRDLIELLAAKKYQVTDAEMGTAAKLRLRRDRDKDGDVIASAIRNNLIPPITRLHRGGGAQLSKNILSELKAGRVVIVDTSLLGSEDALAISGLVLHRIFSHNKRHFTEPTCSTVRCLAVMEEAQTVLGDRQMDDRNIFVRWVKEGRKYGLGCVLVTQQPGAIADQIISQGDNFFVMHLLNESDLRTLARHNGHYGEDILSFIRNEPIKGNCYFWTAPDQPFVLPARVANFADVASLQEPLADTTRNGSRRRSRPDSGLAGRVAALVLDVIAADPRVWVYPAASDGSDSGLVVLSQEYLLTAVAARLPRDDRALPAENVQGWLQNYLPGMVAAAIAKVTGRGGEAVLAGSRRAVWVLGRDLIPLVDGKCLRSEVVELQ